ncbi:GNAT family N-acetyltransferase [Georgenia subflava]|uniref:GNAT family N-acetyltransferase n=1 Tax=Georgenia subflava TaxID=1622177 RepID=A0A6N7ELB2_9MICO|nr:GNAT family N-acetyltransferase [Georgenia subflava]MPV38850.1 GNAT family N-acetyltransferase [Georgenia subflava]
MAESYVVDRYRPSDHDTLYEICLRTGDAGQDASGRHDDPALLGHVYLGAYLHLEPGLARVLRGVDGVAAGYVVGTADTVAFEKACHEVWWPPLRARYPLPAETDDSPDADLVRTIHRGLRTTGDWLPRYPAHLHVDLLPPAQGNGHGRALLETFFDAVGARGAAGVHLGVGSQNVAAIGFYEHLGLRTVEPRGWGQVMAAQLPLTAR